MMMAVLMHQIVDQIESISLEAIDEREPRPMTIAETHHAVGLERDDPLS